MSVNSNPFHSTLVSIFLQNADASESVDVLKQNTECVFHRLEMESSVFDQYPSGALIVQDRSDLITKLYNFTIDYVVLKFENGDTINFKIHSASHVNNAASKNEASFVAIYFTNYIYHYSQQNTLTKILNSNKPKVYRIDKFISEIETNLASQTPPVVQIGGLIDQTENYVCYRPLNPKMDGTEVSSDNLLEYLNYLSSLSVPLKTSAGPLANYADKPRFLLWTDWESKINFRCMTSFSAGEDPIAENRKNLYNFRYAIYDGDVPEQKISNNTYKKIYSYSTNQGYQFITKDYYYVRKTPKILDTGTGNTYYNLAYQFLDEGSRYNIETVGSSTGKNSSVGGSEELIYPGNWGYAGDDNSNTKNSNSNFIGNQYGYSKSYHTSSFAGLTGSFEYVDNPEMWKNMFDLTPLDPYYPDNVSSSANPNASNSKLQKVIDIRYNATVKGLTGGDQLELIRKIELQNFILYSLCCMGVSNDDSFFAMLTSYNASAKYDNEGTQRKWLYGWSKIKFVGTVGSTPEPEDLFNMIGTGWTLDSSESSGSYSSASDLSRFAINLNETGNKGSSTVAGSILPPGWANTNSTSSNNFKYRPIGAKSNITDYSTGDIKHIVKMYKKSWSSIFAESGYTGPVDPADASNILYYFIAENVVDGTC